MADISTKFLYEVENGKKGCSAYVLYRLATALGIKSDYVMNGEEDARNPASPNTSTQY